MSALRNVGELASPYFLVEVWARRDEIDIDPETYASLKRKARSLVRDARGFDMRGQEPDEDWRARRRGLLALDGLLDRPVSLEDGSEFPLRIWQDGQGQDALLVGELPGFADPDRRAADEADPPSTRFELALDAYSGDADWGLLLTGLELRVYRRSSGISQQYLALDLDSLVELDDESTWRAFAGVFRANAFAPGADGVPLIRRVVDESRSHASALAADMREHVVAAAEELIQGALDRPENRPVIGEPTTAVLRKLFEETLYYLYRLLFVLYAESRNVLPISGVGPYATTYSLDHLVERARLEGATGGDGVYFDRTLRRLFGLLWSGPVELATALGIEPVGGALFDPSRTRLLDRLTLGDRAWRAALVAIAVGAADSMRARLGRRSSFAELGVDQLGSIYEGLLVLEPYLASGRRLLVRGKNGERRVVTPGQEGAFRVVRELAADDFVLESASGRRKGSGSFYTPAEITEYLAHAALDPIVEPILALAEGSPAEAERKILALRVLDPAMGSGAFLVQAARVLGLALARARAAGGDGRVTPADVRQAEREIVRHCIYGVDLNPLAVVLAKVSLWLETLEPGRPLSFLDAHLCCGDSLVGVELVDADGRLTARELVTWPAPARSGLATYLRNEAGLRGEPVLKRLRQRKAPRKVQELTLPGLAAADIDAAIAEVAAEREHLAQEGPEGDTLEHELALAQMFADIEERHESLRNRLRDAANLWCAQWFSDGEDGPSDAEGPVTPATVGDFEQLVGAVLRSDAVPTRLAPQLEAARRVAKHRHFFHWALEFPEVMIGRGGFDAVIGNPPWNTLSPDDKEFFATYDPSTFARGVPKPQQDRRKAELRENPDIDSAWRREARFLYELSEYAKPTSGRFGWYAEDGQLRKGDANVFRLFVERAYRLLRPGGRLAQVLPDSVYVSSPATGVRRHLLAEGRLERCYVFENRRQIFPIDSRIKVVLLTAQSGAGPTERFRAAFYVGKDAAGRERAIGLGELPEVLAALDSEAPELTVEQLQLLAPETWAFPELQTVLDAEIVAQCATSLPPLNLDERGWGLSFCRELDADKDAWRFTEEDDLPAGSRREGLRWIDPDGVEWWPLIEGSFYQLEFPQEGKAPTRWVNGRDVAAIPGRRNDDGTCVMEHYRVSWRDVARSVDERSAIATVLPPRTAAKDKAPTVWGGSMSGARTLALAGLMSSFCFDYLVRFKGATSLKYAIVNPLPSPCSSALEPIVQIIAEVTCRGPEYDALWNEVCADRPRTEFGWWEVGERRAKIDAEIALAYGLSLEQYAAVLASFPNLDTIQPMLPGEPKSFVTRDLALMAFCERSGTPPPDVADMMRAIGADLPVATAYRTLDARVARYRELGAVPYRPTPRGGRPPTDPELVAAVGEALGPDPQTAVDIAEALDEDAKTVKSVLDRLVRGGEAFAQGKGKRRSYYVVED